MKLIVSDKIRNRPYKAPLKLGFLSLHRESEDRIRWLGVSDPYNIVKELPVQFSLHLNGRSLLPPCCLLMPLLHAEQVPLEVSVL